MATRSDPRTQRRNLDRDDGGECELDGTRIHRWRAGLRFQLTGRPAPATSPRAKLPPDPVAASSVARELSVGYDGTPALSGVDFEVGPGARIGLLGPNGGGKTTLFRALTGELKPMSGELDVSASCATVPQTDRTRLDYPVTCLDVATMGALARLPWWRRPGRKDRAMATREPRDGRSGRALAGQLRRPLRRPAPAGADREGPDRRRRTCCCSTSPTRDSTRPAPPCWTG